MKRVGLLMMLIIHIVLLSIPAYAKEYTTEEAVNELMPHADDYVPSRNECIIALSRMIGANDDEIIKHVYTYHIDADIKNDIDYSSYKGRCIFLANNIFGENIYPTRKDFFFGGTDFYGEYPASIPDILSWMTYVLKSPIKYEGSNLIDCATELGLLVGDNEHMSTKIDARIFKILSKRFLNSIAYHYISSDGRDSEFPKETINIEKNEMGEIGYEDPTLTYLDVFNQTYRDKNIRIKNDGIYLGENKLDYEGAQPYVNGNGVMMMPVLWFAELFGFENIVYDENTDYIFLTDYKWVKKEDIKLVFQINSSLYGFKDSPTALFDFGIPASIVDGSIYIPMRSVCESLLYNVVWEVE